MRTAVDSNVLLDLLAAEDAAAEAATRALAQASSEGPVVLCPVVYAELAVGFDQQQVLEQFLQDLEVEMEPFSAESLWYASDAWANYTRRRGRQVQCPGCGSLSAVYCSACASPLVWRQHLIADFLIGGHALSQADLLITRDRGYFRAYFPRLKLVVPGAAG